MSTGRGGRPWRRPPARGGLRRPVFTLDHPDLDMELLTLPTSDGHEWDGLLVVPRGGDSVRRKLAVLVVHGSVGNYISGIPRRVTMGLARAGFTVLSINTRMANYGAFFGAGLLHLTPLDLDAAMAALRRRGYTRIVLLGFSMGSTIVTHYQALRRPRDVVGLCTLAHPASLANSLRRRWERFGASPNYDQVLERARAALGPVVNADSLSEVGDEIFVVDRASGPTDAPSHAEIWTYRTWWFSRGPGAEGIMSRYRILYVRVPVLFVQAGDDVMIARDEGDLLARFALEGGSPSARVVVLDGADHVFSGHEARLIEEAEMWLDEIARGSEARAEGALARRTWGRAAPVYDRAIAPALVDAHRAILDLAGDIGGVDLLDVGCGTGAVAALAVERGAVVTAIDVAPKMVERARARPELADRPVLVMDAESLALPESSYDRVIASFSVMFCPHPDRALSEACRVLRPGGLFCAGVWGTADECDTARVAEALLAHASEGHRLVVPGGQSLGDPERLARLMEQAGFRDVRLHRRRFALRYPTADDLADAVVAVHGDAVPPDALADARRDVLARIAEIGLPLRNWAWLVEGRA